MMKLKAEEFAIAFEVQGPPRRGFRYRLAVALVAIASRLLRYRIVPVQQGPGTAPKQANPTEDPGPAPIPKRPIRPEDLGLEPAPDPESRMTDRTIAPFEKLPRERGPSPAYPAFAVLAAEPGHKPVHFHNADGSPCAGPLPRSDGEYVLRDQDGSYRLLCVRCGFDARNDFAFSGEWPPICEGCKTRPTTRP